MLVPDSDRLNGAWVRLHRAHLSPPSSVGAAPAAVLPFSSDSRTSGAGAEREGQGAPRLPELSARAVGVGSTRIGLERRGSHNIKLENMFQQIGR